MTIVHITSYNKERQPVTKTITPTAERPSPAISYPRLITTGIAVRFLVDTGTQLYNPFLPIIARGLGLDIVALGQLVSLRSAVGLLAPVTGALADRLGARTIMRTALLIGALGLFLLGSSQSRWQVALGMILSGLSTSAFIPNLQAYLSERLPYATRARGLGMIEYAWALAGIVGLFAMGQLIERAGWRAPFFVLSGGLVVAWVLFGTLPADSPAARPTSASPSPGATLPLRERIIAFFDFGIYSRPTYAAILTNMLIFFAALQLMITHGAWLSAEYGVGPIQLGSIALLLGIFDLCASVAVSLFTDRIGKKRSVLGGHLLSTLGYAIMPLLNVSLPLAVTGIVLARSTFEFAIVSAIPLLSEQAPSQRAKVLTLSTAATLLAGTLASITGPLIYTRYGVWGLSLSCLVSALLAIMVLVGWGEGTGGSVDGSR